MIPVIEYDVRDGDTNGYTMAVGTGGGQGGVGRGVPPIFCQPQKLRV